MGLAVRRKFKQTQSAGTLGRLWSVSTLRKQLWRERSQKKNGRCQDDGDDAPPRCAV